MSIVRVISANLGGHRDTTRLMHLANQSDFRDATVTEWYKARVEDAFKEGKFYDYTADVFCLQEFYPTNSEKEPLVQKFYKFGFTLLQNGDLGIAFKTDRFILLNNGLTTKGPSGALYAHLRDKLSGKEICIVSHHLAGFDAKLQKLYTLTKKLSPNIDPLTKAPWEGIKQQSAKDSKDFAPWEGDQALAKSLNFLKREMAPHLFVAGLDANATASYLSARVHPKRLQPFSDADWICDQADKTPTIIDHNLEPAFMDKTHVPTYNKDHHPQVAVKYDYLFAKTLWGHGLRITSKAIGPSPEEFGSLLSDHRPVYAEIQLTETWSSRFWSISRFFRLLGIISIWKAFLSQIHFPSAL